jgi:hypothetical protein
MTNSPQLSKIETLAIESLRKPADLSYYGKRDLFATWGLTKFSKHSSSDAIEISNFEVIYEDMIEKYPYDIAIETFRHWAFGTVDTILCQVLNNAGKVSEENITDAFYELYRWYDSIENNYPLANESHYLELLHKRQIEVVKSWGESNHELIDQSGPDWYKILHAALIEHVEFDFGLNGEDWPNEDEFKLAIYKANLCNSKSYDMWYEWSEQLTAEKPMPFNPNQLELFGKNYG